MSAFDPRSYWEQRLRASWGLHGVGFGGLGREYNAWLYRVRRKVFEQQIARLQLDWPNQHVLDVGAGTGFYLEHWKLAGVGSVAAADLTTTAVERLQLAFPGIACYRLDLGEPLSDSLRQCFDLVSAFDMLFHIVDDQHYQTAIANLATLARPGGYVLFTEVFMPGREVREPHIVLRDGQSIKHLLDANQLTIIARVPVFMVMHAPVRMPFLNRIWFRLMRPIRRSEQAGMIGGGLLYLLELALLARIRYSASIELVICRVDRPAIETSHG